MARIRILVTGTQVTPPAGITYDHTDIAVTDSASATSKQTVNGKEAPANTVEADVASGVGSLLITAFDTAGNPIGSPVPVSYDTAGTGTGTFLAPSGATVTVVSP